LPRGWQPDITGLACLIRVVRRSMRISTAFHPTPIPWSESPSERLWYLVPMSVVHLATFLVGAGLVAALPRKQPGMVWRRIGHSGLFVGLLLLVGSVLGSVPRESVVCRPRKASPTSARSTNASFAAPRPMRSASPTSPGRTGPFAALHEITTLSICGMISKRKGDSPRSSPSASIEHLGSDLIWMALPV
jgi:hypothetical protein